MLAACLALAPPSSGRRAVLANAAALACAPLGSSAIAPSGTLDDDVRAGLGQGGALSANAPVSLRGSGVEVLITDPSYKELDACPKGMFIPPKGGPWQCIEVSATALNQGKREVNAADVFGALFDAEGYSPAATSLDPSQKTPFATLETRLPKGQPVAVKWVSAVQARSPRPFRFAGMKAEYRNAAMAKTYKSFDPCEIDSSACEEDEDQPDNAMALRTGQGFTYKK